LAGTLKRVAAALKQSGIPFALGGSFAVYAHGGHSSDHDVDCLTREQDKERVLDELAAVDFEVEQPPEDWLVKVYDNGRLVDLIYRPVEMPVTDAAPRDNEKLSAQTLHMPAVL